jgi:cell division protein FtsQ
MARLSVRVFAGVVLFVAGLALGWLWFRDSSFARVQQVLVTGSSSSERAQVRDALVRAGTGLSTLHTDEGELRAAVRPFASVAGLRVHAVFPHKLRIEVVEHEPVARVDGGNGSVPATGGGLLLPGVRADGLPAIKAPGPPAGGHVTDARTLGALEVAAAAPAPLRARAARVWFGSRGLTLDLRDGPALVFGSAAGARAKWRAAARVLADPSAAGAIYLDLRVPKLVAAGGVGPITLAATGAATAATAAAPAAATPTTAAAAPRAATAATGTTAPTGTTPETATAAGSTTAATAPGSATPAAVPEDTTPASAATPAPLQANPQPQP